MTVRCSIIEDCYSGDSDGVEDVGDSDGVEDVGDSDGVDGGEPDVLPAPEEASADAWYFAGEPDVGSNAQLLDAMGGGTQGRFPPGARASCPRPSNAG